MYGARRFLMFDGDSSILLDVIKVDYLLHVLSYHDSPLIRLIIAVRLLALTLASGRQYQFDICLLLYVQS